MKHRERKPTWAEQRLHARVAELEADTATRIRDAATQIARIAELEAQVAELGKGESREWVKTTQLDELQNRIAELEAERDSWRAGTATERI